MTIFTPKNIDPDLLDDSSPYRNRLLVAMPSLQESAFARSVVYVCAHSDAGAMGIVVNQRMHDVGFGELMDQLRLPSLQLALPPVVHFGGPVERERGFVLHSNDFVREDTVRIDDGICITATIDILKAIAEGQGPRRSIFALGYAGWGPGQLEREVQDNAWLTAPASDEIIFGADIGHKWERALGMLGIDPLALSSEAGHA